MTDSNEFIVFGDSDRYQVYADGRVFNTFAKRPVKIRRGKHGDHRLHYLESGKIPTRVGLRKLMYTLFKEEFDDKLYKTEYIIKPSDPKKPNFHIDNIKIVPRHGTKSSISTETNIEINLDKNFKLYGNNRYKVFEDSRIYDTISKEFITPFFDMTRKGISVSMFIDGAKKVELLRKVVYTAFNGKCPRSYIIDYKLKFENPMEEDNTLGNLIAVPKFNTENPDPKVWNYVYGYESLYIIDRPGTIKSLRTGKIVEGQTNGYDDYRRVSLTDKDGILLERPVAHHVWRSFHKREIPKDHVIDHKDRNPKNNHLDNLRLATYSENNRNKKITKVDRRKIPPSGSPFLPIDKPIRNHKTKEMMEFPGYTYNVDGQIMNPEGKILTSKSNTGYPTFGMRDKNGINHKVMLHRIKTVMINGISDDPTKTIVNHINRQRDCHDASNLAWCTPKDNVRDGCGVRIARFSLDGIFLDKFISCTAARDKINEEYENTITTGYKKALVGGIEKASKREHDHKYRDYLWFRLTEEQYKSSGEITLE